MRSAQRRQKSGAGQRRFAWVGNSRELVTVLERNGNLTLVQTQDGRLEWLAPHELNR